VPCAGNPARGLEQDLLGSGKSSEPSEPESMAAAKSPDVVDAPVAPPAPAARKGGGIGLILAAVLLSTLGGAGAAWFVARQAIADAQPKAEAEGEAEAPPVPKTPALYFALEPAFIVNLDDERVQRFLQVQVEIMSRDAKTIEQLQRHAPRIRSQLLLLFGQQSAAELATRPGKEKLQAEVLAEIQAVLRAETGKAEVEAVYFTSFVIQ
jgi:flagellar protein FliL